MNRSFDPILKGCKVLELAGVLAGPSVGMFLAELGADVIKVENPATGGDVTRSWKLPIEPEEATGSSYFNSVNWGKSSLFIDLNTKEGREKVYRHIETTDILITSYKPGDAEKLGMTPEKLHSINPGLIYAAVTGFGTNDKRAAYDALIQAESGFMHLNRQPGGEPLKMPVALIDILAAHHLKELVLIAWIQKLKTGEGSFVDVSLFEAAVSSLANQAGAWLYAGEDPTPLGSEHPHIFPYGGTFKTADDRFVILAVGSDRQFQKLCKVLNMEEVSQDPRFKTNQQRSANRDDLRPMLTRKFRQVKNAADCIEKLQSESIPCGLVSTVSEAVEAYRTGFPTHSDHSITGIPTLCGRINRIRASKNLQRPE